MKLCHIVPSLQEQHGGPSKSVRALCRSLARLGHTVELLATAPDAPPSGREIDEAPNLRIRIFRRDAPERFCRSAGLKAAVRQSNSDIIHHHSVWLRTLHYAHRAAERAKVPFVVSPRGMLSAWAWRHHRWRKAAANLILHPGAFADVTGWHATSPEEAREIGDLGFRQSVCVAPNGVEPATVAETQAAAQYWRDTCPATGSHRTAVFYGRFHQKKRVIELIDTWLESATRDWVLLMVGLPEQYTPADLERYIQNSSGAGRIHVFAGTSRPPPYAVASLFLLPSHNENFGLTVAEAMAHGVPALVTDTTPWQAVNDDARGWCVPWSDYPGSLRRALAENPDSLRDRGQRARDWVLREYSWDRAAELLARYYGTLSRGR